MFYYVDSNDGFYATYIEIDIPVGWAKISEIDALNILYTSNKGDINKQLGIDNYKAFIHRKAKELQENNKQYDALILLKTIGE